jgi:hypothetical protein
MKILFYITKSYDLRLTGYTLHGKGVCFFARRGIHALSSQARLWLKKTCLTRFFYIKLRLVYRLTGCSCKPCCVKYKKISDSVCR